MDFTNLDQQYNQYWQGVDQSNYIKLLIQASQALNSFDPNQLVYDNTILSPESLFNAVVSWNSESLTTLPIVIPDGTTYSQLYDTFTYNLFLKLDTAQTNAQLQGQPSWVITGLQNSVTQLGNIGKGVINTVSFLTNPYVLLAGGLLIAYLLLKDKF